VLLSCDRMPRSSRPSVRATLLFELSRAASSQAVYSLAQDVCKDTYISIYTYTYTCTHTYIYTYSYSYMHAYTFFILMSASLPFLYLYRYRYISYPIEGAIHMMYGLCAGGALTRTVEPPYKASVPRCILGPRWVHTAVPSRVRHAACRSLRAVRLLLRCCVACNWLRSMQLATLHAAERLRGTLHYGTSSKCVAPHAT
jgi:hypothetical protein